MSQDENLGQPDARVPLLAEVVNGLVALGAEQPERATALHAIGDAAAITSFIDRYTKRLYTEDLVALGSEAIVEILAEHLTVGQHRATDTPVVRYSTASSRQATGVLRGHLDIVTDDMPFLVASVTGALSQLGIGIHLIAHPTFVAERGEQRNGELARLLVSAGTDSSVPAPVTTDTIALTALSDHPVLESWMHFDIDPLTELRAAELLEHINGVLRDVRISYHDWHPMQRRVLELAENLSRNPPQELEDEAAIGAELLRWLVEDNFTFLGFQEYDLIQVEGQDALRAVPGSGLGVLTQDDAAIKPKILTRRNLSKARERQVLILTKANSRATVHRNVYLDYVGVKRFDQDGVVTGEYRILGLYASSLYTQSVRHVPVIRHKVERVLRRSGSREMSYSGREVLTILETYPRDELFQADTQTLYETVMAIRRLAERRLTWVFLRMDAYERFVTVMVYLPRDTYTTAVRLRITELLRDTFNAESVDHDSRVSESTLARLYFVARPTKGASLPEVDDSTLRSQIVECTRSWADDFAAELGKVHGAEVAADLHRAWSAGIPESYKENFSSAQAVADIAKLTWLSDGESDGPPGPERPRVDVELDLAVFETGSWFAFEEELAGTAESQRAADSTGQDLTRFLIYRLSPLSLAEVLPLFAHLGVEVIDERPYQLVGPDQKLFYVYSFGIRLPLQLAPGDYRARFIQAFAAAWVGWSEDDLFDRQVLGVGLTWGEVALTRAYIRYLRQLGLPYSTKIIADTLVKNRDVTLALIRLFDTRFDPGRDVSLETRKTEAALLAEEITAALDGVSSLDEDRILRQLMEVVLATDRTSYYQRSTDRGSLSIKLDPAKMSGMPQPVPAHEIWVYSPRVEGVHLRFGDIARGGLRWSDRREDFRTEVLGLVKAQVVKNAVIVPTGAKGCFVPKQLPSPTDRQAFMAEGEESYRVFIRGLLALTDNQVTVAGKHETVAPDGVVCFDAPDPYLVVAADKGTARFSDTANQIAAEYGFWLGDAFASGGSNGYDHKAMGITARGAWRSVERHFRELDLDVARDSFTAIGIGDMSGDVFGNGMLLSHSMQLVAAFDHRHIFLDPNPDGEASWAERRRLYDLPGSSWADYRRDLISPGGGVHPRGAKFVEITPEVAARLDLPDGVTRLAPNELIRAILTSPADLLFNGGIGTYVKAEHETHAEVGDKANDAIRVNGSDLRVRVVGEGGNLGLTQLGRVEAGLAGIRLNTDAVDNSAGVDTSDHEVNIKILLAEQYADDDPERAGLLHGMTEAVADLVLAGNYAQNLVLGVERVSPQFLPVYRRFMLHLEEIGLLDRVLEGLPTEAELDERQATGTGLISAELSVLVAYAKIILTDQLLATDVLADPCFDELLVGYFPAELRDRFGQAIGRHPLASQIKATLLAGEIVNRGGTTFAFSMAEESNVDMSQVALAWAAARHIFGVEQWYADLAATDNRVHTDYQVQMTVRFRRMLGRSVRWLIEQAQGRVEPLQLISHYRPVVAALTGALPEMVGAHANPQAQFERDRLTDAGVPDRLASKFAFQLEEFPLLGVAKLAAELLQDAHTAGDDRQRIDMARIVAEVMFCLNERYQIDALLYRISALPRQDRWQVLSRSALRDDVWNTADDIARAVLACSPVTAETSADRADTDPMSAEERIERWEATNVPQFERARETFASVTEAAEGEIAPILVAVRVLRSLT